MRVIRYFFVLVLLAGINTTVLRAQGDVINQVKETIKAGSAKELSRFLNATVDVTLDDGAQSYSKAQAEFVFRDFFKQHPPGEFNIIHQGTSREARPLASANTKAAAKLIAFT